MAGYEIFETIARLREEGRGFAVATVIRSVDATSAKAGAKAAISADGEISGHLGGGCVRRAVRDAALAALGDGSPKLIRVKPKGEDSDRDVSQDGAIVYDSGCPSGGTMDLLIEPYRSPAKLVVFGSTPVSQAIAAHGAIAGFAVFSEAGSRGSPDSSPESLPAFGTFDPKNFGDLEIASRDFVVVASQGQRDMDALRAAIASPARRVSMVASRRKARVLVQGLLDEGFSREVVDRLKAPAGLDLKGIDPADIAVSVIAELVLWRNTGSGEVDDAQGSPMGNAES